MSAADPTTPDLEALLDQGRLAELRGQTQSARDLYERALHSLVPGTPAWTIARLLLGIGRTHLANRNLGAALDCVEAVIALPEESGMDVAIAEAHELRGRIRWREGLLGAAAEDFTDSRHRARLAGRPALAALGATHLADLALLRGDSAEAIALAEMAVTEYRSGGDEALAGLTAARLATLYADAKRWNAAEQAFAAAAASATQRRDEHLLAILELARAEMALDRANVERAQASAERALDLARRLDDVALIARALTLNGVVARELGDHARAERLLEQGDRQAQELDDLLLIAETARERADLLARDDRHAEALGALNRAYRALAQLRVRGADGDATRRLRRLDDGFIDVVRRWAQRIESKDHATAGHCDRVADLTCEIARRMGVESHALVWYRVGAYLHDIGKLEVPPRDPEQGRATERRRVGDRQATPGRRRRHAARRRLPLGSAPDRRIAPRVLGWLRLPARPGRRGDPVGGAHLHRRRRLRRPRLSPLVQGGPLASRSPRRDASRRGAAVRPRRLQGLRGGRARWDRDPRDHLRRRAPARVETREPPLLDDALTSVADRASWTQRAARLLGARQGNAQPVALLLLDIDHFSRVNATYGRLQGDDLLWAVAKVLQRGLRTGDLIGRRGSDEFVILLPATTSEVALEIAERLRDACARLRCARRDAPEEEIAISVSVAVASAPQDGETVEGLLAATDRALYRAKRDGRDRVVVADQADAHAARARLDFDAFVAREDELRTSWGSSTWPVAATRASSRSWARKGSGRRPSSGTSSPKSASAPGRCSPPSASTATSRPPTPPGPTSSRACTAWGCWHSRSGAHSRRSSPTFRRRATATTGRSLPSLLQEEIVRAVRRVARDRLLVLVFEDMQWADAASWAVLDILMGAVDAERLFIVVTLRPDEARSAADWRRRLTQRARASQLSLRRFTLDELRRWAQVVFRDADPGDEFPRILHEYTEGIPLNVVHVLHAFAEAGGHLVRRHALGVAPAHRRGRSRPASPSSSNGGCNGSRPRRG
jgi:diguanylate cyclase (GGDEF)-like protein